MGFIILALRSPHLLEAERKQEKSSNLYWVLSHWRGKHLDLHCGWRQRRQLLCHALKNCLKTWSCHLRARHVVQILADINVALRDVLERSVTGFFTNETWLEQHFRATTFIADSDDVFRLGVRRSTSAGMC